MKKKIKITKFMENGAEIIASCACSFLFIRAGIDAGILPPSPFFPTDLLSEISDFSLSNIGVGAIGAAFGLSIFKNYINELKNKDDSALEFESSKVKKNKI